MPRNIQTMRENRQLTQVEADFKALQTENLRLRTALLAPKAADARLEAAQKDALALQIDMETLERIEKRMEQMRRDIISRRIRDRVMELEGHETRKPLE